MDAKTLCLGVLMTGAASGYEIRKMFDEGPFAHFQDVGYGSIYPALAKLLDEGAVEIVGSSGEGNRERKVYQVTEAGRGAFRETLSKPPARDKIRSDTAFLLFFAEFLDPDHLRDVYDDYLNYYRERADVLEGLDAEGISDGRLFVRGLGLSFYRALADYMTENRDRMLRGSAEAAD